MPICNTRNVFGLLVPSMLCAYLMLTVHSRVVFTMCAVTSCSGSAGVCTVLREARALHVISVALVKASLSAFSA